MEQLTTSDPLPHVRNVREEIHDLVEHLRNDAHIVKDPKARALFETSAEVLSGLERAFEHFASHSEPVWQK